MIDLKNKFYLNQLKKNADVWIDTHFHGNKDCGVDRINYALLEIKDTGKLHKFLVEVASSKSRVKKPMSRFTTKDRNILSRNIIESCKVWLKRNPPEGYTVVD